MSGRPDSLSPVRNCANCDAVVAGQYCSVCGQRDRHRMITVWELVRDLVGDLFDLDSRLWRTVLPLLFRPGFLTREYLRGRRVHFTPPLRMYLVLSVVFFLVAGIDGDPETAPAVSGGTGVIVIDPDAGGDEVNAPADAIGAHTAGNARPPAIESGEPAASAAPDDDAAPASPGDQDPTANTGTAQSGIETDIGFDVADCEKISSEHLSIESPAILARLKRSCEKLAGKDGLKQFGNQLTDNLPAMLLVFLPLIALFMKLLYIGSRRYYVEHLLFFAHYHSFFFLAVTLFMLLGMLPGVLPGQGIVTGLVVVAVALYVPAYLYRAMRVVYRQTRLVSFMKFVVLSVAYAVGLLTTFVGGAIATALMV